jgi:PIN domain nuclease of toxin-antitoxin system
VKVLIDTHILIWAMDDPTKLSAAATSAMSGSLSAATVWEMAIKLGQGKMKLTPPFRQWMDKASADLELTILPITVEYAEKYVTLADHHKDPFDRLIIAQALTDGIQVVSADSVFDAYGAARIW